MSVLEGSRYEGATVYSHEDKYYIGSRIILQYKEYPDNIIHTVSESERLDTIAYKYWKNSEWWYIICDWNDIFNPFEPLVAGTILSLPSFNRIAGGEL
ncbi:MAG: hypothetical protein K0Q47_158 [Sedimentibacter sp.]|jgi:hypothetical protein|nr:hypothetical protein [Sedimentibacter sp.]